MENRNTWKRFSCWSKMGVARIWEFWANWKYDQISSWWWASWPKSLLESKRRAWARTNNPVRKGALIGVLNE